MQWWYQIVELLPFRWAAPGGMYFFKNALLAVLVVSPLLGILSTMVVGNRMSFFSDALGHSAFTGIAAGSLLGFVDPVWCAMLLAVLFALLFSFVKRRTSISSDAIIGVFSSTAVALGIFIATFGGKSFTKFNKYLIGDILSVDPSEISMLFILLVAVFALWVLFINKMSLTSAHTAIADSRGVRVANIETVFAVCVAVVVTAAMRWVGLLVINSLLVLPAAAARNVSGNMRSYHAVSVAGALVGGVAGLLISFQLGSSAGASISLCLAFIFLLTFLARTSK